MRVLEYSLSSFWRRGFETLDARLLFNVLYNWDRSRMHEIPKLANSRYRKSNTETQAQIMLQIKHRDIGSCHVAYAVWHTVAARHTTKTIKPSVESSSRPTDDAHNRPHPWPTTRRRSESRRDMDVCPPTVPIRNLDIFWSRTSIWVLLFCVRAPQTVRRRLAKFRWKSQVSIFQASWIYLSDIYYTNMRAILLKFQITKF